MSFAIDKIFKLAKGFRGRAKNCKSIARERVEKALEHSFVGRKLKKRQFRSLWITRISAAVQQYDLSYSRFMHGLVLANIKLDRKILSDLCLYEPYSFKTLISRSKEHLVEKMGTQTGLYPKGTSMQAYHRILAAKRATLQNETASEQGLNTNKKKTTKEMQQA